MWSYHSSKHGLSLQKCALTAVACCCAGWHSNVSCSRRFEASTVSGDVKFKHEAFDSIELA